MSDPAFLSIEVRQQLGHFTLDAAFATNGGVTALFGRSGSGKTSLLRIIAGLSKPEHGRLTLEGITLLDIEHRVFVPGHRRRFGYVFQEGRLFPHLTVRHNLGYGRWFSGKTLKQQEFDRVVDLLGIEHMLERRPARLSGGEKQRVAIGRALLSSPRLLLMDEPLAALDEERKAEILPYLERLRDDMSVPIIYVSHSVAEVARLADRVVLMGNGKVKAVGSPSDVLSHASDRRDAGAVLTGKVAAVDPAHGLARIRLSQGEIVVPNARVEIGHDVRLHLPERDVMVATRRPEGISALNILEGTIVAIEPEAEGMTRLRITCGTDVITARITALSVERLALRLGMPIFAIIKTVALQR